MITGVKKQFEIVSSCIIYTQTDPVTRACDSSDKLCYMFPDEDRSEVERNNLKRNLLKAIHHNISLPDV